MCDSFQGLPEPGDKDKVHRLPDGRISNYCQGMYDASLETVRANVRRWPKFAHVSLFLDGLKIPSYRRRTFCGGICRC